MNIVFNDSLTNSLWNYTQNNSHLDVYSILHPSSLVSYEILSTEQEKYKKKYLKYKKKYLLLKKRIY
jgi:hypothetical protein